MNNYIRTGYILEFIHHRDFNIYYAILSTMNVKGGKAVTLYSSSGTLGALIDDLGVCTFDDGKKFPIKHIYTCSDTNVIVPLETVWTAPSLDKKTTYTIAEIAEILGVDANELRIKQ